MSKCYLTILYVTQKYYKRLPQTAGITIHRINVLLCTRLTSKDNLLVLLLRNVVGRLEKIKTTMHLEFIISQNQFKLKEI